MTTIRMTEAELARDLRAALDRVRHGTEIVIERDHLAVAVLRPSAPAGRSISEVVADLHARGSSAVMDDEFAHAIRQGIEGAASNLGPASR